MNRLRLLDIMAGRDRSVLSAVARLGLGTLELPYRGVIALRNSMFDSGLRRPRPLPAPTISVGNLTAGGTGKTPMVVELARRLVSHGARPAILLRGYMPDPSAPSDEWLEYHGALEELVSAVPVVAHANRSIGASQALQEQPSTNVFILDDGFQHRQVHRDLNLVLIDGTQPFGFEHVLPRGLLREPAENLRRADAVIVTRADQCPDPAALDQRIAQLSGRGPIAHCAHAWIGWRSDASDAITALPMLREQRIAAACAIGNPDAFRDSLERHVQEIAHFQAFADHHRYEAADLRTFFDTAHRHGAQAIVITEKDWVKWRLLVETDPDFKALPIYRPVLRVRWLDGIETVDELLRGAIG